MSIGTDNLLVFDRRIQEERSYWIERMSGGTGGARLPLDFPPHAGADEGTGEVKLELGGPLFQALTKVTSGKPFLDYVAILTALKICLLRSTGDPTVIVGSPARKENAPPAPNVLAILDRLDSRLSFRQMLLGIRQTLLDAYARQRYPYPRLVEDLGLADGGGDRCPLFDVTLAYEGLHESLPELRNSLSLRFRREQGRLVGEARFRASLFQRSTIERFASHLKSLLERGLRDLERPVAFLSALTEAERHQIAIEWNDLASSPAAAPCLHERLEEWAHRDADRVAVTSADVEMTCGELNRRASRLARHLLSLGLHPEDRVGICMERSPDLVVCVLGILKAGLAYVPLDPAYPEERLAYVIGDAGTGVILTEERLAARLAALGAAGTICLDRDVDAIAGHDDRDLGLEIDPARLAYVIYTSGSTGRPKGALLTHGGLSNLARAQSAGFRVGPRERVLQFASLSFDASISEIAMALWGGARLCLAPPLSRMSGLGLLQLCRDQRITTATLPPSFLATLPEEDLPDLATLAVAGEACPEDLPDRWGNGRLFLNAYGPTEVTVCATMAACLPGAGRPSIGRPIANVQVHLLGPDLEPVPIGCPGELYVGGAGLGRGYSTATLTAERFVPDPFGGMSGGRLYRTGDLARRLPDGRIDFLGRIDRQVKVRGFRIELGEIEAALHGHPAIRDCVVIVREDGASGPALAAYFVVRPQEEDPGAAGLRAFLRQSLPEHMVPATFTRMEALPLSLSGKVEARALPVPAELQRDAKEGAPPRSPVEEILAGIFARLLRRERLGIDQSFFDLGGHSLLATQAVSRACEAFQVNLSLRDLFEAPTVAGLAERIEQALKGERPRQIPPIQRVSRASGVVLSFAQRRLWFLDRFEPGNPAYHLAIPLRLLGRLDLPILRRGLDELIRRHEILRTVFELVEGEPVQRIQPPAPVLLPLVDLSALPPGTRRAAVVGLAGEEAERPFDLSRGPVLRAVLLGLEADEHVLLLTMHHIVSDAWSLEILTGEMAELYDALAEGRPPRLPELPVQYADFAAWQREWLRGEALERELSYWRRALAGAPPVLTLPTDRPLPALQTFRGSGYGRKLSGELSRAIEDLGRRGGATLFMTLLAAFQALLSRYAGQQDISVGTPISGRNHFEIESLIGFFVNMLVIRADLSGAPSFLDFLGRVREAVLGAFVHQEVPFDKLIEDLQPQRNLGQTPLFQALFVFQRQPAAAPAPKGLRLSPLEVETRTAKLNLTLAVVDEPDGLSCFVEYNTDLFDASTIHRFTGHLETLLQGAVADPRRRLGDLSLLSAVEQAELAAWNDTRRAPRGGCVHHLFEAQAERSPEAVALVSGPARLTYRELDERSSQVARALSRLEVGRGALVGLCVERGAEALIALLGILKAGAAYIPLDPTQPAERLARILAEAHPRLVVTSGPLETGLPQIAVDRLLDEAARGPREAGRGERPGSGAGAEDLAYVIFTSGSTGRPKGVEIPHGAVVNFLAAMRERPGLGADDVLLAVTTLSFDIAVLELLLPLTVGACTVIASRETVADGERLVAALGSSGATVLQATPSGWRVLLEAGWPGDGRMRMLCGGEALSRDLAEALLSRGGQLWNVYGPTEATVWCAVAEVRPGDGPVPIGSPIANLRLYVLDGSLGPVPVGVPGHLYIAGEGLARGYLGQPDLTAASFLPDPFSAQPGGRMYASGDLARRRPDGMLECLGRIDRQVKLRGFRIELEEIELALQEHPAVREAAVLLRQGAHERLEAFVSGDLGAGSGPAELRELLRRKLPDYMVPAVVTVLDELPHTPNGKLDRRALAALEPGDAAAAGSVRPRDLLELQLAQLWEEVLEVRSVGVRDNFFSLGGHSLLAVRLASRIHGLFGQEIPLSRLFQEPTVEHVAGLLRQGGGRIDPSPLVPLQPRGSQAPFFCVHPAGGGVLCYQDLVQELGADRPFYGLRARGWEEGEEPSRGIEEMACFYLEAVRRVQPLGSYLLGGWSFGGLVAFEMARQLEAAGENVALLALLDTGVPDDRAAPDDAEILANFLMALGLPIPAADLRKLGDVEEQLAQVVAMAKAEGLLQADFDLARADRYFRVCKANLESAAAYRPGRYGGRITLFRTREEGEDPTRLWESRAAGGLEIHETAGRHADMVSKPHAQSLAAGLRRCMARAESLRERAHA